MANPGEAGTEIRNREHRPDHLAIGNRQRREVGNLCPRQPGEHWADLFPCDRVPPPMTFEGGIGDVGPGVDGVQKTMLAPGGNTHSAPQLRAWPGSSPASAG